LRSTNTLKGLRVIRLQVQLMKYVQHSFADVAGEFVPKVGDKPEKEKSSFSDPAFASNKVLPVHRWVPWIAGFASEFVGQAIDRYVPGSGVVLDTFAGVGTTLVEALLRGKRGIGFEINPYAALVACVKINAHAISPATLQETIAAFRQFYGERATNGYVPNAVAPPGFKGRAEFYSPKVLRKVLIVQDYIATLPDGKLRDLFRTAFASTMVRYSNYSYEPSLGRRTSAGKEDILDWPVEQTILAKLQEMHEDIIWLRTRLPHSVQLSQVIQDTFFRYERYLPPASIDLIVTSPPYMNNYHYNRNTRPQLYWLGYMNKPKDFNQLEQANFGKYWQTVRELEKVELEVTLPGSDLATSIEKLRSLNVEKGIYGGNGWANYAATYFNDCRKFAHGIRYALKPGGSALVVIGNSILQGIMLPTDKYFGEIAQAEGLELVNIHIPRSTRVGNSIIQSDVRVEKAEDNHTLYEAVVELRRR